MSRSRKGVLICFIGLDGTGKTLHALELIRSLRMNHYSCTYVHGRWDPSLSYPFLAFLRLTGYTRKVNQNDRQYLERYYNRSKPVSLLWRLFVLIDETLSTFFKVTLPLRIGKIVVCDRYVYDVVVDAAADLENASVVWKAPLRFAFDATPSPCLVFLMNAPESCAFGRKNDTPNMKYLQIRRRLYQDLARHFRFIIINSMLPAFENQETVLEKVREFIGPICE